MSTSLAVTECVLDTAPTSMTLSKSLVVHIDLCTHSESAGNSLYFKLLTQLLGCKSEGNTTATSVW